MIPVSQQWFIVPINICQLYWLWELMMLPEIILNSMWFFFWFGGQGDSVQCNI